jgi:hypothetical protein
MFALLTVGGLVRWEDALADRGRNAAIANPAKSCRRARCSPPAYPCGDQEGRRNEFKFQQYFRDVHTITQRAFVSASRYESAGALMLGKESDWGFFAF